MENMRRYKKYKLAVWSVLCIILYAFMVWMFDVPSIVHIPSIRIWWDREFVKCQEIKAFQNSLFPSQRFPLFLSAAFSGRLGNWMYAYASLYGLAKDNGRHLYFPPNNYLNAFSIPEPMSTEPQCPEVLYESRPAAFDSSFQILPSNVNITIRGYLQSWKYFRKNYDADIRKHFKLKDSIMQKAIKALNKFKAKISRSYDLLISIHIRRTDKLNWDAYLKGFRTAPVQYFLNARKYMRQYFKDKKIQFLVMSDDYLWSVQNLKSLDTDVIEQNDKYVDLAVLTMCNHSIISVGTFGWWGAYLANGHTVYFQDYASKGSRFDQETERGDFYIPEWIGMS